MKNKSQSPLPRQKVFGRNHTDRPLSFPEAIQAVMGGKKIKRIEWGDKEEYGLLKDNFLMIYRNDKFHTWIVSEGDMFSIDWIIV